MRSERIAIVGGGITGLTAAYTLERQTDADILLIEASDRLGGKIGTRMVDGLLVEQGPDCFFARKPAALELVCELGLEDELIEPKQKEFSMLVGGQLHRVPGGVATLTYSDRAAIQKANFLSAEAKARVLQECDQPRGEAEDESIHSFFTRRFGEQFSRLVAEPLLAGTHGGDPARLSMRALYPGYFELERQYGSMAAGMGNRMEQNETHRPTFRSLRGGMSVLVQRLVGRLTRTQILTGTRVSRLDDLETDSVLFAIPANAAAPMFRDFAAEAAADMAEIPHHSSAIVTLAYRRAEVSDALEGTGFLVPSGEPGWITGCTWSSEKWEGRAPAEIVLMRVFMGARFDREDVELVSEATAGIEPLLGISGEPVFWRVDRWTNALPQYELGHVELVDRIEERLRAVPGIFVAGTSYRGVGIPDCIRQGRDAARKIVDHLNQ